MKPIQLEMHSVNHLEMDLIDTDYLNPFISKGDKEPSWDGFVYIHSNKEYKKKDIGKVPI